MDKTQIYIADNQDLTRIGLVTALQAYFNDWAEFSIFNTKLQLFEAIQSNKPHLIIIDFDFFDFENYSEFGTIKGLLPSTALMVITDNQNPDTITAILGYGIMVYIEKSCSESELLEAVNSALNNRKYLSNGILEQIIGQRSKPKVVQEHTKLTVAETEIVRLITQGLTTKEIANQKCLSFHTVITHRKNIFRKLNINSTSELMLYAMRNGIIDSMEYYI